MADSALLISRAGLYVLLALVAGLPLYHWLARPRALTYGRWVMGSALIGALFFSALWLVASAASMMGTPLSAVNKEALMLLLGAPGMGMAFRVRIFALGACLFLLPWAKAPRAWTLMLQSLLGLVALFTLAWTGHAAASSSVWQYPHLMADFIHMAAAALWMGALFSLLRAVFQSRLGAAQLAAQLADFSRLGTWVVVLLVLTGLVNIAAIAGIAHMPQLLHYEWGQWLALKLLAFCGMLGLAALNRWWLTPHLLSTGQRTGLRLSLLVETSLWLVIVALVAHLGRLDPSALA